MIAMIFEFRLVEDDAARLDHAATSKRLMELLSEDHGFVGIERFESSSEPGKFLALGWFEDDEAVTRWRNAASHRQAQRRGRREWFTTYRLRMARVVRDYDLHDRSTAPHDSNAYHSDALECDRQNLGPSDPGIGLVI